MDWIVGVVSLFWDGVFKPDLFPTYLILAISARRRSEWVLLMTFAHAIFLGSIDLNHLMMFSGYAILNHLRDYTSMLVIIPSIVVISALVYRFSIITVALTILVSIYVIYGGRYVEE